MKSLWQKFVSNIHSKTVWILLILFAVALETIAFIFSQSLKEQQFKNAELVLANQVDALEQGVLLRMRAQETLLESVSGLYAASKSVERDEFHAFIESVDLNSHFPGVQAVGFAAWVAPNQLPQTIQSVKEEGFSDFSFRPQAMREHYSLIIFVEPFVLSNRATFGDDIFAEPIEAAAMQQTVAENKIVVTSRLVLKQKEQKNSQVTHSRLMMFAPVYKKNMPLTSEQDRWAALEGFVYTAFHADDLLDGIIQQRHLDVDVKIFASETPSPDSQIYTSVEQQNKSRMSMHTNNRISLYGKTWNLEVSTNTQFAKKYNNSLSSVVLVFGTLLNISLFVLFYFLASQSQRAYRTVKSMTKDIKEKNEELRLNQARFNLALESSSMGIWSWDFVENTIYWDISMYQLFGLSPEEKIATHEAFLLRIHSDDRARVFHEMGEAVEKRKGFDLEFRILMPDGRIKYLATRAKINEGGAEDSAAHLAGHHVFGTCWDVTERKRLDKLKTEFVSTVSHELRTPLTSITGALGLAVGGALCELPDKAKQVLDIAYKNSQRLKLLINDLLDMDKLLAGKLDFHCELRELMPMIQSAVTENKSYADQYSVTFQIEADAKPIFISVEEVRFLQIMANFLSNAAKFSPSGAKVIVRVTEQLHETASVCERWVRISVIDQGIGISEENKAHIFEKFYQADSSDTRKKGGTGLGLAISKELAERMGGRVGFESEVGNGSCFWMEFPA